VRFLLDRALDSGDLTTPEDRSAALRGATGILSALRGSILAHDYVEYVAGRLLVDYETVDAAVRAARPEARPSVTRLSPDPPALATSTRLDVESRAESELLALAAAYPRLRREAQDLLGEGLVTDPDRAAVLEGIVSAGESVGAELLSALEARVPGASATLSAASVDERGGLKVDSTFWQLAGRLRELALRRRISALQARLHAMDAGQDKEAYDKVFAATHELQKRLERQKANPESHDTTEA
jgi:DNA primase